MERGFQHVLDCGRARRTTLRGRENIRKRYLIQAACANLSLLMRHLSGIGTPKQALAMPQAVSNAVSRAVSHPVWAFSALCCFFYSFVARLTGQNPRTSWDFAASR